ncbi:MAG: electron transfer flavoprotein subunit beta/FixA family protein [Proteocatella sp.]|jgi:electron transfer flavoprotein beta subunit|nr:electron transfer flavoprotein subunit beta/FixA family protein [Proteocatella sp.]NCB71267.1 electron transfer flavoprotein subunit beta/FixA family protein [Clostridia bacterium]MBP7907817.1 electron transfer flavoprotein subunit beta/FixA family protein [Proteocatella sp.]MBP8654475.1 electron transfer flavoprotein subunit beta/FixA family protein [Proteocatella sp.]MBP9658897.1 electron transfer flavoprotein subunit beta/FixA family protein [Proteocatella sp.]
MNIVVCIKQVPDTTEVKLDPKTGTLIRDGVPSIINPDDKAGLEAALRIKDKNGSHVTVLTMGPPQADLALREALAMGADRAILLTDRAFAGADTWATSSALAGALKKMDYDLIIAGRQAIDGDTAQVGPQIAEHLNLPSVTYVEEIEAYDKSIVVKRAFEDGYQMIKVQTPCLITALKELNDSRYMNVQGIFEAFEGDKVEIWSVNDIEVDPDNLGLKGSPTKVKKSFTKGAKTAGKVFDVTPQEAAQIIVDKLQEKYLI